MIAVPDLQMKFTGQFFLSLVFSEDRYSSANYHDIFALRIRDTKHESPIKVALAGQRIVMNVGFLIILVQNPSKQLSRVNFVIRQ